eukprot:g53581.t1
MKPKWSRVGTGTVNLSSHCKQTLHTFTSRTDCSVMPVTSDDSPSSSSFLPIIRQYNDLEKGVQVEYKTQFNQKLYGDLDSIELGAPKPPSIYMFALTLCWGALDFIASMLFYSQIKSAEWEMLDPKAAIYQWVYGVVLYVAVPLWLALIGMELLQVWHGTRSVCTWCWAHLAIALVLIRDVPQSLIAFHVKIVMGKFSFLVLFKLAALLISPSITCWGIGETLVDHYKEKIWHKMVEKHEIARNFASSKGLLDPLMEHEQEGAARFGEMKSRSVRMGRSLEHASSNSERLLRDHPFRSITTRSLLTTPKASG